MGILITDEGARRMYAGQRGNRTARRYARFWARVIMLGLLPRRWVTLEVTGRRSGRPTRFPLGMADVNRKWYLVSMLGEDCNWVRNVRAANGRVTLRRVRRVPCRLVEVPVADRAAILRRYVRKAPGGRPHVPVDRRAALADFAAVAGRYPVFEVVPERPNALRYRRWLRWSVGGATLLVVLLGLAAVALPSRSAPPPLTLPVGRVAAVPGGIDGTWSAGTGSQAGFRTVQTAFGRHSDVVGRTGAVTGTATVAQGRLTAATFRVDLTTIIVNGRPAPQFAASLDTGRYPDATVALAGPVALAPPFVDGTAETVTTTGQLTLHGVTRTVPVTLTARRDGDAIEAVGSIPVAYADFGIAPPTSYGAVGSLADHGTAEFLLVLRRS